VIKVSSLGVDDRPRIKTMKVREPHARRAGIKVPDIASLVEKLRTEAKVV
jgi:electron transfer flavoprotein beta subunit